MDEEEGILNEKDFSANKMNHQPQAVANPIIHHPKKVLFTGEKN